MNEVKVFPQLLPYPIVTALFMALPLNHLDITGKRDHPRQSVSQAGDHPATVAQNALIHWNTYLASGSAEQKVLFMDRAKWLLNHGSTLSNGAVAWPTTGSQYVQSLSRPVLSAVTQGYAISVLLRAYQLTGNYAFKHMAQQAVLTFELDILDEGVIAAIGNGGVFFEECAIYPAAHSLSAHVMALLSLYDYVALIHDSRIEALILRGIETLQTLIDEFDAGYWTRCDLLSKRLASRSHHALHIALLGALATASGCERWARLATRWSNYQHNPRSLSRYWMTSRAQAFCDGKLKPALRRLLFPAPGRSRGRSINRVCIPITAFPIAGGMRSVLAGLAQAIDNRWKMVYLTHQKGREMDGLEIETFGRRAATPWHFPFVWLYCLAGACKLFVMLRRADYALILPQDGVPTGAFAAVVGKMAGARIVCMDHGSVTLLDNPSFRNERTTYLHGYTWPLQVLLRVQWSCYWASQRLLARIATRYTDQFLIAGDEVEAAYCEQLGVPLYRMIRYAYILDVNRFTPPGKEDRAKMRAEQHIREDAIVITLINRLAPEKGLQFALEGIAQALAAIPTDVRLRVEVLIAGDGPLRSHIQQGIELHGLHDVCVLWGEASPPDVVRLLAISDIFLYSGVRGTNYSMAVLEAMAAGCAVIASTRPLSNARLLAEGRGIAISAENVEQLCEALVQLVTHTEMRCQMSALARNYIVTQHNADMLRRALMRATFWPTFHEFFDENAPVVANESRN